MYSTVREWIDYIPENSGMPFQWVEALAVDAHGRVWVGCRRSVECAGADRWYLEHLYPYRMLRPAFP